MKWAKGLTLVASLSAVAAPLTRPVAAYAQAAQPAAGRVTGTVTDEAGAPIPGVNVVVVGTTNGAATDAAGRFTIRGLPNGPATLRAQRIGFAPATQTVTVANGEAPPVAIRLAAQAVQLSEVVSIGYGTQSRRDVAGAVATVSTEALEKAPVASIDQVLQGTAPGVQVTTASNEPGGALSVRIRGMSSITGSGEPLYVVDGFPIENDIEGSSPGSGGRARTTPPNPLATLNPSDIESISILKDASSTAIYGARGANGVVIITTKQGKGLKPQFALDYYAGSAQVSKRYDLLDAAGYMDYANAFGQNSSQAFTPFPDSVKTRLLASGIDTDWQDQVFRPGGVRNVQLGVRGATQGANVTRYNVSGGYFDQDGILVGSGLRRLSSRLNVNQAVGARVELGGSFSASQARSKATPTSGQQNAGAGAVSGALQYVPILPVYRADGTYSYINTDLNAYSALLDAPQTPNPVSLAREVQDSLSDTRLLGNLFGQAKLLRDLTARVSFGADYADRWRNTYYPRTTLRGQQANGEAIRGASTTSSWVNENTLTYQRQFGDAHDLTVLGGYSRQKTNVDRTSMSNTNFANDVTGYFDIGAGTREGGPGVSSGRTTQTLESWLSRVNYTLLGRYLFTATYRADGSSRFAANRKWGAFPSAAIGWRLSDEPFMRFAASSLDELKLRASYGLAGNPSIRPYNSLARLDNQGYSFGGTPTAGYYPVSIENPDLTWETTRQTDLGLDLGVFDRVTLTADYYAKRTSNLLLFINLPFETGFEQALANRGVVDNRGFELGLDLRLFEAPRNDPRAFAWRANFNYATNKNKVVDLGGAARIDADLITTDYNLPGTFIEVGKPIGRFYGFKSLGVIRDSAAAREVTWRNFNNAAFQPGSMLIEDVDADGVITLNDRTDIGDPTPKFTLGLTNTFGYKGFELTGLLQGSYGGKVLNVNRIRTESSPRVNIIADRYHDAWTPTNPDAKYPRVGENPNQVGTNNFTDNLLEDGSYLRLRTLSLSYGLPPSLLRRGNFTGARVYVTGANLFTVSDYSGFDPDVSGQSVGAQNRGIDIGAYPLSRTVTFGLSLNY
jgi:TonB-dependent starch-binding outer membrane protein SusC